MITTKDSLSKKEEAMLRNLQAKVKRSQRAEQAFWQTVDDNIDKVREYVLKDLVEKYGTEYEVLMKHLYSNQQIDFFKKIHNNA